MSAEHPNRLAVSGADTAGVTVLTVDGVLDSSTYLQLRDAIIKAALDEPDGLLVDVSALVVPAPSALAVFTSARWLIGQWPDVPMALVCGHRDGRQAVQRNGVSRYVPVYPSITEAMGALADGQQPVARRRARTELPAVMTSIAGSRAVVEESLTNWSVPELIAVAKLVVSVFVENVLAHTDSAPAIRLEHSGDAVTIAVEDQSTLPAVRRESSSWPGGVTVSGLAIVAALCRTWGNSPMPSGKAVWAVIGPENEL